MPCATTTATLLFHSDSIVTKVCRMMKEAVSLGSSDAYLAVRALPVAVRC